MTQGSHLRRRAGQGQSAVAQKPCWLFLGLQARKEGNSR